MTRGITALADVMALLISVLEIHEGELPFLGVLATWRDRVGLWSDQERADATAWCLDVRGARSAGEPPEHVTKLPHQRGPSVADLVGVARERARVANFLEAAARGSPECPRARFAASLGRAIRAGEHDLVADALERLQELVLQEEVAGALGCAPQRVTVQVRHGLMLCTTRMEILLDGEREPTFVERSVIEAALQAAFAATGGVMVAAPPKSEAPS
jgi:hypothetical protein